MARDRDDEYDDRDDRDGGRPARRRGSAGDPERGRRALKAPAIGLILVGLIGLGLGAYGLVTGGADATKAQLAEQRKAQMDQIDAGPGAADQKQQQKDIANKMYDFGDKLVPLAPLLSGLALLGGLLIVLGGVQMMRGRGRGLGMTASVLAMIPCFSSCGCVLGIPVGIWALVALGGTDAKAAFASGRPQDTLADDRDDLR